jgi:Tol biopolymer transport system component
MSIHIYHDDYHIVNGDHHEVFVHRMGHPSAVLMVPLFTPPSFCPRGHKAEHMSSESVVPLESIASLPEFYHPTVSPDGSKVAFYYDGSGRNELYILDRETGEYYQVTDGEVPRDATWWIRWGASGETVLFHRDEAGDEQNDIYASTLDGDTEELLSVDGQGMLVDVDGDTVLYQSDEGRQMNHYRFDRATGERTQLTEYAQPVRGGVFSPSGDRIAYVANESDRLENTDVYVMTADGNERRKIDLGSDGSETSVADWFPDGERLLVSDNAEDLRRVGVFDLTAEKVEWLGPHEAEESAIAVIVITVAIYRYDRTQSCGRPGTDRQ